MKRPSKYISAAICCLAAVAGAATSIPANAHGIWFAQRAKQIALIYGVGADDLDAVSRLDKITSIEGFDAEGQAVATSLRAAGAIPVVDSDEPVSVIAAAMDYGMWTKDAAGRWHNKGKDEVEGAIEVSEHNFKYAVHLNALDAKVPVIASQTLQIVPVGAIPESKGAPLMVKALYKGKPVPGVQILTEYVTDPDETPALTASDGTTTIRLRNQGLNVVVGILITGSDKPAKYDRMEERATLSFVLPHLPE
ncbi:DUF4198 domain-containing protein [Croceicoccus ponticola]|uniref:DUF4198 domain-containing protein n=1 Tax=Croceicoccus ponticola TaxID=2217664 RepID=A0A437H0J2_9SPHN|nr:DUF4198 domain-containing protein [Croceicoccus ponticola]RVQ69150.1 DUF4198 domain-containing protein [Croceicoccus ponticola]